MLNLELECDKIYNENPRCFKSSSVALSREFVAFLLNMRGRLRCHCQVSQFVNSYQFWFVCMLCWMAKSWNYRERQSECMLLSHYTIFPWVFKKEKRSNGYSLYFVFRSIVFFRPSSLTWRMSLVTSLRYSTFELAVKKTFLGRRNH